jgi:hypothetical protein
MPTRLSGDVYLLDAATGQVLRQSLHGPAGMVAHERARPDRGARSPSCRTWRSDRETMLAVIEAVAPSMREAED